jgi:hypothetical protein
LGLGLEPTGSPPQNITVIWKTLEITGHLAIALYFDFKTYFEVVNKLLYIERFKDPKFWTSLKSVKIQILAFQAKQ